MNIYSNMSGIIATDDTVDAIGLDSRPIEHLMSHVMRFAMKHGLSRSSAVLNAADYPHHSCYDLAVNHLDRLPALAAVIGNDPASILNMAHPCIRQMCTASIIDFYGTEVPSYDLILRTRRVAPHAICDDYVYPAIWSHGLVGFCPLSGHEIIDRCPICQEKLGWRYVCEPWLCDCCEEDMRQSQPVVAPTDEWNAALSSLRLLSTSSTERQMALGSLPSDLQTLGSGAVFDLVWRLAMLSEENALGTRVGQIGLTSKAKLVRAALAGDILYDWPQSAERLIRVAAENAVEGDASKFRRLKAMLLRVPHFPQIASLLTEKWGINRHARAVLGGIAKDCVYGKEAERLVGITASDFALLARSSALPCVSETGITRQQRLFLRSDLIEVRATLESAMMIEECSAIFGLGYTAIEQMLCLQLIESLNHPALTALGRVSAVNRNSVNKLLIALRNDAQDVFAIKNAISIKDVFRAIGGRDKPWASLLHLLMTDRNFQYGFAKDASKFCCRDMIISADDAHRITALSFYRSDYPLFNFSRKINRLDVIEYLNLNPNDWDLRQLMSLAPGDQSPEYPAARIAIEHVGSFYLSRHEIRARLRLLRIAPSEIRPEPTQGRTTAGWSRERIERIYGLSRNGVAHDAAFISPVARPTQISMSLE